MAHPPFHIHFKPQSILMATSLLLCQEVNANFLASLCVISFLSLQDCPLCHCEDSGKQSDAPGSLSPISATSPVQRPLYWAVSLFLN